MSYKLVFDDRGVCIDFKMVMDGKVIRIQAEGGDGGDFVDPIFPEGTLIWDDAITPGAEFFTTVTEYSFPADADMGPFNWTVGDHFWFWADVTLPTTGADYQDWMNTGGIMGSMGSGEVDVEMFLLIPTGIVGETHSYVWLLGNATSDFYSDDAGITVDFDEDFIHIYGADVMSLKIVFDDRGVCIDFIMEDDGQTLRLQASDSSTDPTDTDDDGLGSYSLSIFVAPMAFIACLTFIRRRK
jgi:hypothetical protein